MAIGPEIAQAVFDRADCLFDQGEVRAALDEMVARVAARLNGKNPLVLCVMTGGVVVTSELVLRLPFPLEIDYVHATRYGDLTQGGQLKWVAEPRKSLEGRTVLVVDDILDEGQTLGAIMEYCRAKGAKEAVSAVLVDKQHTRKSGLKKADFAAISVPDRYVFGYGMDYKGYWRNAPGIYAALKQDE